MSAIAVMQPYFFPYIGYWQLIHAVDRFVICDDVNYIKGGWINRNRLLINGEARYITARLSHASPNRKICDISLLETDDWRDRLVRTVEVTYRKAPSFFEVFPVIERLIRYKESNLSDYLGYQLKTLSGFLGIKTEFVMSSRIYGNQGTGRQERIIDICKREDCETYINLPGGRELYDSGSFARAGLELGFLVPRPFGYRQGKAEFTPGLSIIDVMMFNPREKILTELLGNFDLIGEREFSSSAP